MHPRSALLGAFIQTAAPAPLIKDAYFPDKRISKRKSEIVDSNREAISQTRITQVLRETMT
jgi:hypothetical protein